jgi:hypothetical protein
MESVHALRGQERDSTLAQDVGRAARDLVFG